MSGCSRMFYPRCCSLRSNALTLECLLSLSPHTSHVAPSLSSLAFSLKRRPLDIFHQSPPGWRHGSRKSTNENGGFRCPLECQWVLSSCQPMGGREFDARRIYAHNGRLMILTKSNGSIVLLSPGRRWQHAKTSITHKRFSPKRSSNNKRLN